MNRKGYMHPICTQKPGRFGRVFVCAHTNALFELFVVIFVMLELTRESKQSWFVCSPLMICNLFLFLIPSFGTEDLNSTYPVIVSSCTIRARLGSVRHISGFWGGWYLGGFM